MKIPVKLTSGAGSGRALISSTLGVGSWSDVLAVRGDEVGINMEGETLRAQLHVASSPSGNGYTGSRTGIFEAPGTTSLALRTGSTNTDQHFYFDRPIGQPGLQMTFGSGTRTSGCGETPASRIAIITISSPRNTAVFFPTQ